MLVLERRTQVSGIAERHFQRGVGAGIADMHPRLDDGALVGHVLGLQLGAGFAAECAHRGLQLGGNTIVERPLNRPLAQDPHVGEAHAVGRQDRGVGVDEDAGDPQQVRHLAGMLRAGAAEAAQRIALGDVDPALDRDLLDGIGHVVVGDGEAAMRQLLRRALDAGRFGHLVRQGGEGGADHLGVQRAVGRWPEDVRKEVGQQLADHQVGVGDRERPAAAVAGGAGIGACTLRSDAEALAVEADDRPAARGHGVDLHHRRADAHARDLGVEGALEGAGIVGDVGRGAAHVEADDPVETGQRRGPGGTDDPARRARTGSHPCPGTGARRPARRWTA